ncbi:hypothetical protein [Bradyrhizobium embrapense]|uniref:hypothetical protein n=1 Tax=Bradyrhizobium embrapense TaxID=630921 RepID=UPI00067CF8CE|nr:hypothetical protein [Bradyrhizobium embrapense]
MTAGRAWVKDRLAAIRSLDETTFQKFMTKWNMPQPRQWLPQARLVLMHKMRCDAGIVGLTEEERQASRDWLKQNGYSESTAQPGGCPACGHIGPSFTDCPTCGMGAKQ